MKVYKFIFIVGFLNLTIPFLGIPFVYKNYVLLSLAALTIGYALIVRTVEKERKNNLVQSQKVRAHTEKTIEDVVDMVEVKQHTIVSDVIPKRRGRKAKVTVHEQMYE